MSVSVLMYHSISDLPGPTSIARGIFEGQMEELALSGYSVMSLASAALCLRGGERLPDRVAVLTFDDGFEDFATAAAPVLRALDWTATVFLPTGRIGREENWKGGNLDSPRRLLSWNRISSLAKEGFDFGGHSVSHPDLTTLAPDILEWEIRRCRDDIERHVGCTPVAFAAPYGRSDHRVAREIRKWYGLSVSTRFGRASSGSDVYDLPRIEMHYYRDRKRWRKYLEGRGEVYFHMRRAARSARESAVNLTRSHLR